MKENRLLHKKVFGTLGFAIQCYFFDEEEFNPILAPKHAKIDIVNINNSKKIKMTY